MKYGDTLQQRSVPLWENYNIDYNVIKHLIKIRTTQGQGQAKAIPGSDHEAKQLQQFESEFYQELLDQHQRIDLFVRSKTGEITRRLAHLDKQISQLRIRSFASNQAKIPIRRLEKFAKAEAATIMSGEDIQSLSRFVGAQTLAFQKLLKKYKKWTGSTDLGKRFREEVLDRPASFSKTDFQPLLAQWTEVLACVRAPFEGQQNLYGGSLPNKSRKVLKSDDCLPHQGAGGKRNSAATLHSTCESGSNAEVDTALAILPLGPEATRAVYWVHPDNLVQIHILLLQYTRLPGPNHTEPSIETPPSPRSSTRSSVAGVSNTCSGHRDDELNTIICDELESFAKRLSNKEVFDCEDGPNTVSEKAVVSIRYCRHSEAVIAVVPAYLKEIICATEAHSRQAPMLANINRKAIPDLFRTSQHDQCSFSLKSKNTEQIRDWFASHRAVRPMIQLHAKRSRFVGLANSEAGGIWAVLDRGIFMRSISQDPLLSGGTLHTIDEGEEAGSKPFPYAILEVRLEGATGRDLIDQLDVSHLTERVRGFSLEAHAVATLCEPDEMGRPFWLPVLDQDIRKMPTTVEIGREQMRKGRLKSGKLSAGQSSTSASSIANRPPSSSFSAAQGESSMTSAPETAGSLSPKPSKKTRRQSHRRRIHKKGLLAPIGRKQQRYWNEFDDGSEGPENEAYTILVDPHAASTFPGASTVGMLLGSIQSVIDKVRQSSTSWRRDSQGSQKTQEESTLDGNHFPFTDDSDLSDEDFSRLINSRPQRRYSTFSSYHRAPAAYAREVLLLRLCLAAFGASLVLLVVAAILENTGRRKAEAAVDAGVIIGVAASLVLAIIAVGSMVGRKQNVGFVHRSAVILVFICVLAGNGALLVALNQVRSTQRTVHLF